MAAKRNRKGQFVKGSGTKRRRRSSSKALARRSSGPPARRRRAVSGPPARRRRARTSIIGARPGGMVGKALSYLGAPRADDLVAAYGLGWVVREKRATVEEYVNKAPTFARRGGAFGVIALAAGIGGHFFPSARKVLDPVARTSTTLALYGMGKRGSMYTESDYLQALSGDGDDIGADLDVGAIDVEGEEVGEDDIGDDE